MTSPTEEDVGRWMSHIEELVAAIEASGAPECQSAARELTATLLALHAAGLRRMLAVLEAGGEPGRAALERHAADPVVTAMLALHELVPGGDRSLATPDLRSPPREKLVQLRVPSRSTGAGTGEPGATAGEVAAPRCELCAVPIGERHAHVVELSTHRLCCACVPCSLLFEGRREPGAARYRRVPGRVVALDGFRISEATWDALEIPVKLAFFVRRGAEGHVVALYPSPAGALEATVPEAAWGALTRECPALLDLEPDVEALLVHRVGGAEDHLIVPIDRCFELTGRLRSHRGGIVWWAPGDSGGEVRRFIAGLVEEAT